MVLERPISSTSRGADAGRFSWLAVARVWAKKQGIYSNKMGYLGGVNFNILVALVCQLSRRRRLVLFAKFFHIFADWNWPSPAIYVGPWTTGMASESGAARTNCAGAWAREPAVTGVRFSASMAVPRPSMARLARTHTWRAVAATHHASRAQEQPHAHRHAGYPAMNSSANVNAWSFAVLGRVQARLDIEEIVENSGEDPLKLGRLYWSGRTSSTSMTLTCGQCLGRRRESFNSFKGFLGSAEKVVGPRLPAFASHPPLPRRI